MKKQSQKSFSYVTEAMLILKTLDFNVLYVEERNWAPPPPP